MPDRAPISGVLIEGVDFVGKTTAARGVAETLVEGGHAATMRRCYMSGSPLVQFLDEEARRYDSMWDRDCFYSSAILLDVLLYEPVDAFLVQDRQWLSQVGRNRFFHPDRELIPDGLLEKLHVPFRFNVLLTSSLAAKQERSAGRAAKSPRDRYLRDHPPVHQEYEAFLGQLIPGDEDWVVLDTTELGPHEVVEAIVAGLEL